MKLKIALLAGLLALGSLPAHAQGVAVPARGPMAQTDLVQVIPNGQPSAASVYAAAGQVAGQWNYSYQVPVTAFSITPGDAINLLYLHPAGTLATGTLTMAAHPGDGQKFCLIDTNTQTAITIQANTGQTLASYGVATPTALVATTVYCWFYIASQAAWVQTQ